MDVSKYTVFAHLKTERGNITQWWLERDFYLLPVQPFSKKLVAGFGPHQDVITTPERAVFWFGERSLCNLAVCGTQTSFILDFDDPALYQSWARQFPDAARTYTERTPRGGYHVFGHAYHGDLQGAQLIPGVELKRVCVIAPSVFEKRSYTRGEGEILDVDAKLLLSPLSKAPIAQPTRSAPRPAAGHLQKIKQAYSCLELLGVKVISQKRFVSLSCPFHEDHEPSFWVDQDRNLWGCHACQARGDVINLYARLKGITVKEAIQEMGKAL